MPRPVTENHFWCRRYGPSASNLTIEKKRTSWEHICSRFAHEERLQLQIQLDFCLLCPSANKKGKIKKTLYLSINTMQSCPLDLHLFPSWIQFSYLQKDVLALLFPWFYHGHVNFHLRFRCARGDPRAMYRVGTRFEDIRPTTHTSTFDFICRLIDDYRIYMTNCM